MNATETVADKTIKECQEELRKVQEQIIELTRNARKEIGLQEEIDQLKTQLKENQ